MVNLSNGIPNEGFLREQQILGCRKKGIPPIIPVSRSTWWKGVKSGLYPQPVKLSANTTAWFSRDIRELVESLRNVAA